MDRLEGLQRADAAIVGGGLTGLLLGASLAQEGLRVSIVDAADTDDGPDAAPASLLCGADLARVEALHGLSSARQYAAGLQSQLHMLLEQPRPYVQPALAYEYARQTADVPLLEARHSLYGRLGLPVGAAPDAGGCPFPVEQSLMAQGQAIVSLPQWQAALRASIQRRGGRIFTQSRVIGLEGTRVCTRQGCVDAPHVILTAGTPPGLRDRGLLALLETRMIAFCPLTSLFPLYHCQQDVRGLLTLTPTPQGAVAAWDASRLGAAGQDRRLAEFEQQLNALAPDWQHGHLQCRSSVLSLDGLPVIGALPGSQILCAAGLHGLLGSMHAAGLLTRRILGRTRPEDALYSPERAVPRRLIRQNTARYTRNLLRRWSPACAHCTCRMRYSTHATHWACPCCGTRYDMLGRVLDGPGLLSARISIHQRPDI